jgi:anti-sigma factor RsiW
MNHEEAVQEMATERYLLDELSPELREAFEEHMFGCQECAFDVRAGNVFMNEAKVQLPEVIAEGAREAARPAKSQPRKPLWSFWAMPSFRPAFAVPAFGVLLAVIAFQNLFTIPSLHMAATHPHLAPWTSMHLGTRGVEPTVVRADRRQGAILMIDLPRQPAYSSYAIDLYDPQGRQFWAQTVTAPGDNDTGSGTLSLLIPGTGLQQGAYTLNLAGISPQGVRTELGRRALDVHFNE